MRSIWIPRPSVWVSNLFWVGFGWNLKKNETPRHVWARPRLLEASTLQTPGRFTNQPRQRCKADRNIPLVFCSIRETPQKHLKMFMCFFETFSMFSCMGFSMFLAPVIPCFLLMACFFNRTKGEIQTGNRFIFRVSLKMCSFFSGFKGVFGTKKIGGALPLFGTFCGFTPRFCLLKLLLGGTSALASFWYLLFVPKLEG